ncbi:hypothetical protein V8F20_006409 [Naviculisporaceae sp. PSN 640]
MDDFNHPREDPLFAADYDSENSFPPEELPPHDPDAAEEEEENPLGEWHPRVVISRHAMEVAELEAKTPKTHRHHDGTYHHPPGEFLIGEEYQYGPWEEVFPNHVEAPTIPQTRQPQEVDWDGWDLESGKPGTGHSARAFLARLMKHPRRCANAECQFAYTGAVGSDIITRHNPHHFWDPKWTLRTGIGTGLPGYSHAATLSAIQRRDEQELSREIAMLKQGNQPIATAVDSRDIFSTVGESSKVPMKRKRDTSEIDDMDIDIDMDTEMEIDIGKGTTKGKGKAKEEPAGRTNSNIKGKTLLPPAEIARSAKRHLNFEAYRTTGQSAAGSRRGGHDPDLEMIDPDMPGPSAGARRSFNQRSAEQDFSMGLDKEDDPFR